MELLLERGDVALTPSGLPRKASKVESKIQRALFCLSIPQGSFPYDLRLGSRLHELSSSAAETLVRTAQSYAQEALNMIGGVSVEKVEAKRLSSDELSLQFSLQITDQAESDEIVEKVMMEVTIF